MKQEENGRAAASPLVVELTREKDEDGVGCLLSNPVKLDALSGPSATVLFVSLGVRSQEALLFCPEREEYWAFSLSQITHAIGQGIVAVVHERRGDKRVEYPVS